VTALLARRLIESGVPLADIEAALFMVVDRGLPLSQALSERDPRLLQRLEQELARLELPSVLTVRPSPELFARLPAGLCQRLLAVPVHVDPRSGRVDVAAVEPLDPHIAQEFAYHLEQPVRVLSAPGEAVKAALDSLQHQAKIPSRSDAPIPLVRRSMLPVQPPNLRPAPPPAELLPLPALSPREQLEQVTSPEAVVGVLRDAVSPAISIVFAVRSASFDGRIASEAVERRTPARSLSLLAHQPSVLETAVKSGFYLGPIPNTPNHRDVRDALPPEAASGEVYVTVVTVSNRPSLVWLIAGFEQSLELTRRADELTELAARAIARILRERKKRGAE